MLAVAVMLVLTFVDVVLRVAFSRPITGVTEICEILMAVMLTAMGGSLLAGKTIKVDVLIDKLPKTAGLCVDTLMLAGSAVFCVFVGIATIMRGQYSLSSGRIYIFIGMPQWPFLMLLGLAFFMAAIASIMAIILLFKARNKDKSILDDEEYAILRGSEE